MWSGLVGDSCGQCKMKLRISEQNTVISLRSNIRLTFETQMWILVFEYSKIVLVLNEAPRHKDVAHVI